jgi:hypothetical protein
VIAGIKFHFQCCFGRYVSYLNICYFFSTEFMINPYCEALKGFFAEMVYYGLLKDEDAQCFRTDVKIEPTFYLLFTSAICLALINSFVMKAVSQYFRDIHFTCIQDVVAAKSSSFPDVQEENWSIETSEKSKIHPVPVLFTDRYRWFLRREDEMSLAQESENLAYSSIAIGNCVVWDDTFIEPEFYRGAS